MLKSTPHQKKKKVTEKLPCGKVQNENGDFNKTEVGGGRSQNRKRTEFKNDVLKKCLKKKLSALTALRKRLSS